jgi:HAD superfamily hydrolase (TIGR01509 family)
MTYKAVGFDYGGVITGEPSTAISREIANLLGVSEEAYTAAYYHHNIAVNKGLITWDQLWIAVLADLEVPDKHDQLITYLRQTDFGKPNQKILELITSFRQDGLKLGLLSNNTLSAATEMRQEGLDAYFDVFDISAETGLVKPDPATFREFARQLQVKPSELIFIDDSPKSLSTAAEVGYAPVLYDGYDHLTEQLHSLGLSF